MLAISLHTHRSEPGSQYTEEGQRNCISVWRFLVSMCGAGAIVSEPWVEVRGLVLTGPTEIFVEYITEHMGLKLSDFMLVSFRKLRT